MAAMAQRAARYSRCFDVSIVLPFDWSSWRKETNCAKSTRCQRTAHRLDQINRNETSMDAEGICIFSCDPKPSRHHASPTTYANNPKNKVQPFCGEDCRGLGYGSEKPAGNAKWSIGRV